MAVFWLLLRPVVVVDAVGEVGDGFGVGGDVVVGVSGVEVVEVVGMWGLVVEDVGALDALVPVVGGPAVVGVDDAVDTALSPPSCELVHKTGFCPLLTTMLKSLLMKVGGVALEVRRSVTSKWHTQAFPSSRGTRAEPVADTERLYAGGKLLDVVCGRGSGRPTVCKLGGVAGNLAP